MFIQTWARYIPVIRILLKRSLKEEQKLSLNSSDFLRAAGGRKVKFVFSFAILHNRLQNIESTPPVAQGLIDALQQDVVTAEFVKKNELEFSLNKDFQLVIKNITPVQLPGNVEDEKGDEISKEGLND